MIKNKKERTPSPDPPGPMKNPNPVAGLAKVELIQFQGVLVCSCTFRQECIISYKLT